MNQPSEAGSTVSVSQMACDNISAAVTPERAGIPPKSKAFSIWAVSRCQEARPEACWAVQESSQRICCVVRPAAQPAAAAEPKMPESECVLR